MDAGLCTNDARCAACCVLRERAGCYGGRAPTPCIYIRSACMNIRQFRDVAGYLVYDNNVVFVADISRSSSSVDGFICRCGEGRAQIASVRAP